MATVMTLHQAIGRMLNTHPQPSQLQRDLLAHCIGACVICSTTCTACADACLAEGMEQELTECIRTNLDCAEICRATAQTLVRQTMPDWSLLSLQTDACRAACVICAKICEQHAAMHEHCGICAEACHQCEAACDTLLRDLSAAGQLTHP